MAEIVKKPEYILYDLTDQAAQKIASATGGGEVTIVSPLSDNGNVLVAVAEDLVGLAKESTLSSINAKIIKCDTDNVRIVYPLSANNNVNVNINEDSIGLAKESTLSSIDSKCFPKPL